MRRPLAVLLLCAPISSVGVLFGARRALAADPPTKSSSVDVFVDGDALLPRATDDAVASSVVSGEALRRPGLSLADALSETPSVKLARSGSGDDLTTVGLRGATSAQTPVYLGHVRLNDEITGTADLSLVPSFFLRRIDVYRGNSLFELGEPAIGGAVVLSPDLPTHGQGRAEVGFGSFGETNALLAASGGNKIGEIGLALSVHHADNDFAYLDDRGTRFDATDDVTRRRSNADATTYDGFLIGRARLGERSSLLAIVNLLQKNQGVTGLGNTPAQHARAENDRVLFDLEERTRCGSDPKDERCVVETGVYGKVSSYHLTDPFLELPYGTPKLDQLGERTGFRTSVTDEPWPALTLQGGFDQTFDDLQVRSQADAEIDAQRSSSRVFATGKVRPTQIFTIDVDLSAASITTQGPDSPPRFVTPEGRLGARLRPIPELDLHANVARYVRVPSLGESFGASDTVLGNPALLPEKGPSTEAGARFERRFGKSFALAVEGVFFARFATDLIAYERSSFGLLRPYNVGSARFLGGEFTLASRIAGWFRLDGSLTLTDGRDTSLDGSGSRLTYLAPVTGSAAAHLDLPSPFPGHGLEKLSLGTTFVYRGVRLGDPSGLIELPPQALLDADLMVALAHGIVAVRGRVSNLTDDHTTDTIGFPLPGRAGHLSLETVLP